MGKLTYVGTSQSVLDVHRMVTQVTGTTVNVLLTGESGTGKSLVAEMIHDTNRKVTPGAFVTINCAAIPPHLLESELFGHKKGSFTGAERDRAGLFEVAEGGTVFLDEIGEMSMDLQCKLLTVLETRMVRRIGDDSPRKVDFRLITATNRNLRQRVRQGDFRDDLYYRIAVVPIHLPSLVDLGDEDKLLIANKFLREYAIKHNRRNVSRLTPDASELILAYSFPGNVRELRNVIEYGVVMSGTDEIDAVDLSVITDQMDGIPSNPMSVTPTGEVLRSTGDGDTTSVSNMILSLDDFPEVTGTPTIEEVKILHTLQVMRQGRDNEWSLEEVADRLGISKKTLWQMRDKHQLDEVLNGNLNTPII